MELYEYSGEPQLEEILHRKSEPPQSDHLGTHLRCPACNGLNTEWVRNEWHICFNCEMAFTTGEATERYIDLSDEPEEEEEHESY